jgi:hypothetical protein
VRKALFFNEFRAWLFWKRFSPFLGYKQGRFKLLAGAACRATGAPSWLNSESGAARIQNCLPNDRALSSGKLYVLLYWDNILLLSCALGAFIFDSSVSNQSSFFSLQPIVRGSANARSTGTKTSSRTAAFWTSWRSSPMRKSSNCPFSSAKHSSY